MIDQLVGGGHVSQLVLGDDLLLKVNLEVVVDKVVEVDQVLLFLVHLLWVLLSLEDLEEVVFGLLAVVLEENETGYAGGESLSLVAS